MKTSPSIPRSLLAVVLVVLAGYSFSEKELAAAVRVSVVRPGPCGPGAKHGLKKLEEALKRRGIFAETTDAPSAAKGDLLLLVGIPAKSVTVKHHLQTANVDLPSGAEALVIHRTRYRGKPTILIAGSDDRGLMYALLDVADRIGWAGDPNDPLSEIHDTAESPYVSERALSIYTMHRACFESRFFDEDYWARYLDMLAENRFNSFVLIFGYENAGYFAPPYPFLFDVDGFEDVRVVGLSKQQQRRNLDSLNRLIEMTHERGLNFTLGIWDHIYRGGVQGPTQHAKEPTPGVVWGLSAESLVPYSQAALPKLLAEVHNLDAIQFRMHGESGLRRGEMEAFWTSVYKIMKEHGPGIRFDARAKNFPHALIDKAIEMDVPIRICTKYLMEQMGMPFHPTHIHPRNQHDRRHGYADLLRYPKSYDMHWRLWNAGTTRILLWGDPEYVRRFAESTHLYGGQGFEVTEPMGTKMQDHPHGQTPFELLRPQHQYYDWEFERYWHFFQVFGRVGYNPHTPADVWQREFERRFGLEAAAPIAQAIHRASQIAPRMVTYSYPYHHFPTTRGWVERQRQEDLPGYAKALPSDTQQFLSMDDAARCILEGEDSAKIWPRESSRWFARAGCDVLKLVAQAEDRIGDKRSKEFVSTMVDMKILANLALYHSHRARAGVLYALFTRSQDVNSLTRAIGAEGRAIEAWEQVVESAGDVYCDDIMMGRRSADLSGHWKDELVKLNSGLQKLRLEQSEFRPKTETGRAKIAHVPVRKTLPEKDVVIRATIGSAEPVGDVRVAFGTADGDDDKYEHVKMRKVGPFRYSATIPAAKVTPGLRYFIEATDAAGKAVTFPAQPESQPIAVCVTSDARAPTITHEPIQNASAEKPLAVTATVSDPSGVKWVRLRYRSVNQTFDYKTLEMLPEDGTDRYRAVVPGEEVVSQWDFMYLIEVMDNCGNGKIHPDLEEGAPYVVVKLER